MKAEQLKKELIHRLFDQGIIKFGEFTLKSGKKSPFYVDLRLMVSYPDLLQLITDLLISSLNHEKFDAVAGIPYTALPLATLVGERLRLPQLILRKEAKTYGTKGEIIGVVNQGDRILLLDDLITSGESILENLEKLENHGLNIKRIQVVIDRSGGEIHPELKKYNLQSVLSMEEILEELYRSGKLSGDLYDRTLAYLKQLQSGTEQIYSPLAHQIRKKILSKKSNLILSLDATNQKEFFEILDQTAPYIFMLKTHVDILEDFDENFIEKLSDYARQYDFLIFEDRKFADIGNTVRHQYHGGIYKISSWSDFITVHGIPGEGILRGLFEGTKDKGGFLLARMSSAGNLMNDHYTRKIFEMGKRFPQWIAGYIVHGKNQAELSRLKNKIPGNQLMLMPGVRLQSMQGKLGQQYVSVEEAMKGGVDAIIVGSGIIQSVHPGEEARRYRDRAWEIYSQNNNQI